jgi:hypothetical protein
MINKLDSLSDFHLKINFVLSFILLIFTAMIIFYIPMYKVYSLTAPNEDYGHVSLWRFHQGKSDYTVWFIFWDKNFDKKCANRSGCIEVVCNNKQ